MACCDEIKEIFIDQFSSRFTDAFVHEIKNPVALIKAHIEFLELDTNLSVYKNNIAVIKKELNKILEIVSDYMIFNKETENTEHINIIPIIKETIKMFEVYNKNNINFSFNINCNEDYFIVNTRPLKISMLFSNVFKNAVEAIKNTGNIRVILYTDNEQPIIDIIDDGEGLSIKNNHINFMTSKKEGSGMGIPICKSILNDIGGKFEIFNNKDAGCTVRIKL